MRIIGLDVGEKRIGVAKADSKVRIAVPVGYINVDGLEWQEIAQVAKINNTNFFVLGLPRSNDGNETAQSLYVRNFAKTLLTKIPGARVRLQDESLTSVVAEERLKASKKKYEKGDIDAEAATIILQDFLESFARDAANNAGNAGGAGADIASDPKATVANLAKKEADRAKLNAKKAKHKMKTVTKVMLGLCIVVMVAAGVTTGVVWYKEEKARRTAEYYASLEANMEAATFDFTIRPGETIYDIKKSLLEVDRNGKSTSEERLPNYAESEIDAALAANYDFAFLAERPIGVTLEGFLYPETYNFYGESTVEEVLTKYLEGMNAAIVENNLEEKYAERGLTLYEGVTLASVVQKEAPTSEMPTVAQVFLSRLGAGIPLGSDVTVSYALDTIDPDRTAHTDNQAALAVDSCYNTRLYGGLPCGPISNPGLSALQAVAEPSDTAYLYFLTGDDGLMYYSYTESEHIQNIYSHCQELCNAAL